MTISLAATSPTNVLWCKYTYS